MCLITRPNGSATRVNERVTTRHPVVGETRVVPDGTGIGTLRSAALEIGKMH